MMNESVREIGIFLTLMTLMKDLFEGIGLLILFSNGLLLKESEWIL